MKKFNNRINGYDKAEVNSFVSEVTKNYEEMLDLLKAKDREIMELTNNLATYKNMEISLNKALLVAENASHDIKRLAKEEGNMILDEAKKNASRIINNALLKAERTEADADSLRIKINVYKKKIRQIIEEQLDMMETIDEK